MTAPFVSVRDVPPWLDHAAIHLKSGWITAILALLPSVSLVSAALPAPIPAFPGAEGAGCFASGGRGGAIVHVTNLNPAGPGSLADAVSQSNQIVVFDVSGIIDLSVLPTGKKEGKKAGGKITINQPNITIAGQTAPGEGICLKGGTLQISAGNVVIRHLRSRRGWNREGDMGDAIEVKPIAIGVRTNAEGRSVEDFEKIKIKKEERGKQVSEFADLNDILIDHCSASWATDENLTVTHAGRSTVSWCIAAEGCDYHNPKQTPPNHSEGSLWGSAAPDGRSTMHHMLYAHNRLRNPRTTGGSDLPPVLTMFNCVIYNWSEYPTHTGSERVHLNWLNNSYKPGPDTPAAVRSMGFEFHGDPQARVFARGNLIHGSPAATANNALAVGYYANKFKKVSDADKAAMIAGQPFGELPPALQTAEAAFESVLADAGATLPARDAADWRIVNSVRAGTGKVIGKEIDLPAEQRWPDYRSLPKPQDTDNDGIPDFWEKQFGFDSNDPADSAKLSNGYANIEHYFNNSDPAGGRTPIVFVAATVSRANASQPGEWRVTRTGNTASALTVYYAVSGDAQSGVNFTPLTGTMTIPANQKSGSISLLPLAGARDNKTVVVTLTPDTRDYFVGCPSQSLIVIRR